MVRDYLLVLCDNQRSLIYFRTLNTQSTLQQFRNHQFHINSLAEYYCTSITFAWDRNSTYFAQLSLSAH